MKFNLRQSVATRISLGYLLIIVFGAITTLLSIIIINKNQNYDAEISDGYFPYSLMLKEFSGINLESKRLINNWVYQPNKKEKNQLQFLSDSTYPAFKKDLLKSVSKIESPVLGDSTKKLLASFEVILNYQQSIMQKLSADSLYSNDVIVDECINNLEINILPQITTFNNQLNSVQQLENNELNQIQEKKKKASSLLTFMFTGTTLLFLVLAIVFSVYSTSSIVKPIIQLTHTMNEMAKGKIITLHVADNKDEIGQMTNSINQMAEGLQKKSLFAEQIGHGNYDASFEVLSDEDTLGQSILMMRSNLKLAAETEKQRSWANIGIAQISEILRDKLSSEELYHKILSYIVKYLQASQGGLFIVGENSKHEKILQLKACYAYERKKFLEKEIDLGEGLIGQCYLEKQTIFLTDCPEEYVNIVSGTGAANPRCISIVPLISNEVVFGILELASFKVFEPYQIEFLEKISENLASGISNNITNEKTQMLLKASIEQSEALRSQEEEMRQNLEEMAATQEEMARKEQIMQQLLEETKLKENEMKIISNAHQEEVEKLRAELAQLKMK
jgi:HAMP domain-containing protein/GAF domain-containing protein